MPPADREHARQAIERLRSSDGWRQWLATRRHFHTYSLVILGPGRRRRVACGRCRLVTCR